MQIKKDYKQRIQFGTTSLLLIFTVLCLVVFSILSLASAKADYRLSVKNEESVKAYYAADSEGELLKKEVNKKLIELSAEAEDEESFKELVKQNFKDAFNDKDNRISYTIDAGADQFLMMQLQLKAYDNIEEGKQNYTVVTWIIENKEDYEVDDSMPVWSGV